MHIDKQLEFSLNQAETTVATHYSTNIVNQGHAGDAAKDELYLEILITEGVTSDGAATVQFKLQTATDESFTTPIDLIDFGAKAKAALTAGTKLVRRLPAGALQYLRIAQIIGTAALTAGKYSAFLTPLPQTNE